VEKPPGDYGTVTRIGALTVLGDATMKVKIQPMCQVSEDSAHATVPIYGSFTDAAGNRKSTARVLDLGCNLQSGKCDGATFDLSDLTSTGGINLFTMNTMVNATIEKTFVGGIVVRWGIHAIEVNVGAGTVTDRIPPRESNPDGIDGIGSCKNPEITVSPR